MLANTTNMELFFVYGLIALVIILIIVIIIIDKRESRNRKKNLFDTLNMKIIANPNEIVNSNEQEKEKPEILEIHHQQEQMTLPIEEAEIISHSEEEIKTDSINDMIEKVEQEIPETDLEKTQAQLRVEEITNALKNAQIEEQIQEDKYKKFEEEQEKNAIISYHELKESFDKLYSENEKNQYLDDSQIPINMEELYQLKDEQEFISNEEKKSVSLPDFTMKSSTNENPKTSTFKNSPFISPVYGIQEEPLEPKKVVDKELKETSEFLQKLKELKNNLD